MAAWDPAIYTPWIEYDICKTQHAPGCNCAPMPGGVNPITGETEATTPGPASGPTEERPAPTVPAAITLPFSIPATEHPATTAEILVAAGLRPDLAASIAPAIAATGIGWWVTSGRRTVGEQEMLMRLGQTQTPPDRSNHVPCPGEIWATAIDLDPAVSEAQEAAELARLASLLRSSTHPWRWGGTFSRPSPHHFDVEKPC